MRNKSKRTLKLMHYREMAQIMQQDYNAVAEIMRIEDARFMQKVDTARAIHKNMLAQSIHPD